MVNGKMHRQDKMRRWGLPVLLSSPLLAIGEQIAVRNSIRLRHPTELEANYEWEMTTPGHARGVSSNSQTEDQYVIEMDQQENGIHWCVGKPLAADAVTRRDRRKLSRYEAEGSIVFFAHPWLHRFEWSVPDSIANRHVVNALKKQPFRRYRGDSPSIVGQLKRLEQAVTSSAWQAAAMQQMPTQLWRHHQELTEYQVWVGYRVATRQLNLFHEDRPLDNSCRKLECCAGVKETLEHVFWECPTAKACWQKLICHWMEERWSEAQLTEVQRNCANRQAPTLSVKTARRLKADYPDTEDQVTKQWKRLWHVLSSVCITTLWIQRNRVMSQHEEITLAQSVQEFWTTGLRQFQALGKRERRHPETLLQGTWLLLCCAELEKPPREQTQHQTRPVQPPHSQELPELLTRLRQFQASRS